MMAILFAVDYEVITTAQHNMGQSPVECTATFMRCYIMTNINYPDVGFALDPVRDHR